MKKELLFICLTCISLILTAQTTQTINIDWGFSSAPGAAGNLNTDRTIEEGDTVIWTWVGGGSHNVRSNPDDAATNAETFSSGGTVAAPNSYSFTFNNVGTTTYECQPHRTFMKGTITVVAEGTLSSEEFDSKLNIAMYPNPVSDKLYFSSSTNISIEEVSIHNLQGQKVYEISLPNDQIDVSQLTNGIYILKFATNDEIETKKFIKL